MEEHDLSPYISIQDLSYTLPDGRVLFKDITETFGGEFSALAGRNGSGKTILAKMMAGLISPGSGRVIRSGTVCYLDQLVDPSEYSTVADLAGKEKILNSLHRITAGYPEEGDLEIADGNWDMEERLLRELDISGLGYLLPDLPATRLSGGECTRISLIGAFLSGADFLILDEPTNHLDQPNRKALIEYLGTWKGGLLVISHDRAVLEVVERIFELSSGGLDSYGGNLDVFLEARRLQRSAALDNLERVKTERKRAKAERSMLLERQQRRSSAGRRSAPDSGIPRIAMNAIRSMAKKTEGKTRSAAAEKVEVLAAEEKKAFLEARIEDTVVLIPPRCAVHAGKIVLRLDEVVLPFGSHGEPISLTAAGPERIAVTGPNGSGKSTLLRVLMGETRPLSGSCRIMVDYAYLDQFTSVPLDISPIEHLCAADPGMEQGEAGTRLAQVGISREMLRVKNRNLSGGERLKVALLAAIHRVPVPQLLILDEPTNHLDLDSVESVEKLLCAYTGALVVVSHDRRLLENIAISRELEM